MGKNTRHSIGTTEYDVLLQTLIEARHAAKLSQREVARRLGFHSTIYGKIERGDRLIDVVEFVDMAHAMGTDPIRLLGDYLVNLEQARVRQGKPSQKP